MDKSSRASALAAGGITRRFVIGRIGGMGLAATCGGLVLGRLPAFAQSETAAASVVHRQDFGAFALTIISDGVMTLPRSFVLPDADEAAVQALLAPGGGPVVLEAAVNVAVISIGDARVLVDTGAGPDFMPTLGRLADRLSAADLAPEDITHAVFTHGHPDHLWGVLDPFGDGSAFADARHVMTAIERDFWLADGVEKKVPPAMEGMAVGSQRRLKAIAQKIDPVAAAGEIVPGVSLVDTAGHTPGHVSVLVSAGGASLLIGGDALSQAKVSFAKPDWRWGPDLEPERAVATRKRLLDQLATDKTALLGYHLPWPGLGRVERDGTAYRWVAGL